HTGHTKLVGSKIEDEIPGLPLGNPLACCVGSTSVPPASVGQRLGGGGVPCISQLRMARRSTLTSWASGTGFALKMPRPQLFPGQLAGVFGMLALKPPPPPPCVVLPT